MSQVEPYFIKIKFHPQNKTKIIISIIIIIVIIYAFNRDVQKNGMGILSSLNFENFKKFQKI